MADRSSFSITVIKTLFGASPNVCSYRGCDEKLTDPGWKEVNAEIAHICGERPGAARYDPLMSDVERNGYDNLLLLCPKHHKLIDRLDPDGHPVELLREMKARSAEHGAQARPWATADVLTRYAVLLIASLMGATPSLSTAGTPRLQVRRSDKRITMTNLGSTTAFNIALAEPDESKSPVLLGDLPSVLPGGSGFDVGHWVQTFGSRTYAELVVTWDDEGGRSYVEKFPIN